MTFDIETSRTRTTTAHYLMVSAVYRIDFGDHEAIDELKTDREHEGYSATSVAVSTNGRNYRSPRITPRPVIAGPQTADRRRRRPANEIETDKHGRIKVQFHWDRVGTKDENSSCWVRVAQPWAGKGYGMFAPAAGRRRGGGAASSTAIPTGRWSSARSTTTTT